jgi:hypothetical protein
MQNEEPANYNLEDYLDAYVKGAGVGSDPAVPVLNCGGNPDFLTDRPMNQSDACWNGSEVRQRRRQQDEDRESHFPADQLLVFPQPSRDRQQPLGITCSSVFRTRENL